MPKRFGPLTYYLLLGCALQVLRYTSLESKNQDNSSYEKHDGSDHGDAVEIFFHDCGPTYSSSHAPAEHIGQTPTASSVKKDEENQQDGCDYMDYHNCDVEYCYEFLLGITPGRRV